MKRTKIMITVEDIKIEELAPGQYLKEAHETWCKLTEKDKYILSVIIGEDEVLKIDQRHNLI
jgi:hypothetical protein